MKHDKFINKLKPHGKIITRRTSIKEYLRQFEEIYNYHAMPGAEVRLF